MSQENDVANCSWCNAIGKHYENCPMYINKGIKMSKELEEIKKQTVLLEDISNTLVNIEMGIDKCANQAKALPHLSTYLNLIWFKISDRTKKSRDEFDRLIEESKKRGAEK